RPGDDRAAASPQRADRLHRRVSRRLVVDLASPLTAWRIPPWVVQAIRAALGAGWDVVEVQAPAASDNDGGSGTPEATAAARGAGGAGMGARGGSRSLARPWGGGARARRRGAGGGGGRPRGGGRRGGGGGGGGGGGAARGGGGAGGRRVDNPAPAPLYRRRGN